MDVEWDDTGPISQGKIITALLRDEDRKAREMLRGWSTNDLKILERAAADLAEMAYEARRDRRP